MKDILIVDDEPKLRLLLHRILQEAGYSLAVAANGVEAMAMCRKEQPKLVISDIFMPDMDGIELLENLRESCLGQKVIAMSGGSTHLAADFLHEIATMFGAAGFLVKPFSKQEVLEAVECAIGRGKGTGRDDLAG
ncbi:MAG: response regulator [Magnetococcales bacterium]|nr:response regulator [Magnetococcales bacterium]